MGLTASRAEIKLIAPFFNLIRGAGGARAPSRRPVKKRLGNARYGVCKIHDGGECMTWTEFFLLLIAVSGLVVTVSVVFMAIAVARAVRNVDRFAVWAEIARERIDRILEEGDKALSELTDFLGSLSKVGSNVSSITGAAKDAAQSLAGSVKGAKSRYEAAVAAMKAGVSAFQHLGGWTRSNGGARERDGAKGGTEDERRTERPV